MIQRKRKIPMASMLSLMVPGLGHAYLGRWLLGVCWYGAWVGVWLLFLLGLHKLFWGLVFTFLVMALLGISCLGQVVWLGMRSLSLKYEKFWTKGLCWFAVHLLVVFLMIVSLPIKLYKVPSGSMTPTLETDDYFMATRRVGDIKRGEVIVFNAPGQGSVIFVKRVAGLSGDHLEIRDGRVMINGAKVPVPYSDDKPKKRGWNWRAGDFNPVVLPENAVYVLGDNRDNSFDSRKYGPVPIANVHGKALYIIGSKDRDRIGKVIK